MKRSQLSLIGICVLFLLCNNVFAQATGSKLKSVSAALTNIRQNKPVEKLYLQTDKSGYSWGDTLRFKAYLLNGDYFTPSELSGLLYVELNNEQGKVAKRIMVPVNTGLAAGDIAIDSTAIPDGSYTLRAYTNWMQNFGDDYIFKKRLTVLRTTNNPVLVKAGFKQIGEKIEGALVFNFMNGRTMGFKDIELSIMNGRRNVSRNKVTTGPNGSVNVNFEVPTGSNQLSIKAAITGNSTLNIPVIINRAGNTDLQFMPEGGHLVAGINCKVGFKAISEDGKGLNIKGNVTDSKGRLVTTFSSAHAGMGNFVFTPIAGETYSAKVDGIAKPYALPAVKPSGTTLSVTSAGSDSLQVALTATPDAKGPYYLIAHARGVVCYAQTVTQQTVKKTVAKSLFPTGIIRFSLLNGANQPVNERIVFINHNDGLNITVTPHQPSYSIRDSIALAIKVTDSKGAPVEGSFSLAVTDASQVKADSLGSNIFNNMLFTSDLKGNIEDPGYYFTGNKETEIDNLMLTQGWVGYNWEEALKPEQPFPFKPEKEFAVSGKVVNAFGKPVEKSNVILASNHPSFVGDTLTNAEGHFMFKNLFPVDTAIFKLQARNKKSKEFNVRIVMDETTPPPFVEEPPVTPWYLNTDTSLLNSTMNRIAEATALSQFRGEGTQLKEVNITAKKVVRGSKNLNGPGEADFVIDEEEIKKKPVQTSLEEMLIEKFPQFNPQVGIWQYHVATGGFGKMPLSYLFGSKKIRLFFDGIPLDRMIPTADLHRERTVNLKNILTYFTAEDVVGIELMEKAKYLNKYHGNFESGSREYIAVYADSYVYIEITTRAGKGPWMKVTPGTYLYKTTPFSLANQFYSPKYTVKNKGTALGTDLRSTLFWEPDIITDKDGKATVSFYSADKAGKYNVIIEGADLEGSIGFDKEQISIK